MKESRWSLLVSLLSFWFTSPIHIALLAIAETQRVNSHFWNICSTFSFFLECFFFRCLLGLFNPVHTLLFDCSQTMSFYLIIWFALSPSISKLMIPITLSDFSSFHNTYDLLTHFYLFQISIPTLSPYKERLMKTPFFVLFIDRS